MIILKIDDELLNKCFLYIVNLFVNCHKMKNIMYFISEIRGRVDCTLAVESHPI